MIHTKEFDPADYLTHGDDQIDLVRDARASGDKAYLEHALSVVARANGLSPIAAPDALSKSSIRQAFRGQHDLMRRAA